MPGPTDQTSPMMDGLNKLATQISQLMMLPDADLDFLAKLQMAVVQYVRQPPATANEGAAMGAEMGGAPTPQGMPPGMMGGASMGVGTPPMDEMRRMLATQSGGQGG